jgi:hypothetical protein
VTVTTEPTAAKSASAKTSTIKPAIFETSTSNTTAETAIPEVSVALPTIALAPEVLPGLQTLYEAMYPCGMGCTIGPWAYANRTFVS